MPSSHAALVSSLATSTGLTYGPDSPIFPVTLFFGLIVIRDAMGVRRSSGIQAQALNTIGRHVAERDGIPYQPVKEVLGHAPVEVAVGVLLGVVAGVVFSTL